MREATGAPRSALETPRFLLGLAAWAALVAAALELIGIVLRRAAGDRILFVGRDVWWTVPLVDLVGFLGVAVILIGMSRLLPRFTWWWVGLWFFGFLTVFALGYTFPAAHRLAWLLLAIGVATQVVRFAAKHPAGLRRLVRLTLPVLATAALGAVAVRSLAWRKARASAAPANASAGQAAGSRPNVLLIVLDTVRRLNLSLYGYGRETTPQLSRWKRRGVRFDWAFSTSPWTLPSHASMFTGRFAHELSTDWSRPLDNAYPTLAEVLARHGYLTAGFVANTDYASAETGLARGFGYYDDYSLSPGLILRSAALGRALGRNPILRRALGGGSSLGRKPAPEISRKFITWLGRQRQAHPWFAFLNYYDAHRPYQPPEPYFSRFAPTGVEPNPRFLEVEDPANPWGPRDVTAFLAAYDGAIAYLDAQVSELLEELDRQRVLEHTLVIITSDHGEEFDEHELFDHGHSVYLASVHVPLLILPPGQVRPARGVVAAAVSLRNLPATVLDLVGVGASGGLPGRSLAPLWRDGVSGLVFDTVASSVRRVAGQPAWFPASRGDLIGVVEDSLRYIRILQDGSEELFAFLRDPGERYDLTRDSIWAPVLTRLRRTVDGLAGSGVPGPRGDRP